MKLGPYELGPNDTPENGIYTGDARVLSETIPDESVDLIFTDPVYQNIDDYLWLAETAARVLKPEGALLAWSATPYLPEILQAMIPPMEWAWMLYLQKYGPCYPGKPGICVITQCLWLDKGQSKTRKRIADWFGGKNKGTLPENRNVHNWSKPQNVLYKWIDAFCNPNGIVFDPFTGGGTVPSCCVMLNRQYLAFEIDSDTAAQARERVRMTQPPLPGLVIEQPELL